MHWLFPPCATDKIHRHMATGKLLRHPGQSVEWLIHPDYEWHFKWCRDHSSSLECFLAQPD
jgi:hypothetical protein